MLMLFHLLSGQERRRQLRTGEDSSLGIGHCPSSGNAAQSAEGDSVSDTGPKRHPGPLTGLGNYNPCEACHTDRQTDRQTHTHTHTNKSIVCGELEDLIIFLPRRNTSSEMRVVTTFYSIQFICMQLIVFWLFSPEKRGVNKSLKHCLSSFCTDCLNGGKRIKKHFD